MLHCVFRPHSSVQEVTYKFKSKGLLKEISVAVVCSHGLLWKVKRKIGSIGNVFLERYLFDVAYTSKISAFLRVWLASSRLSAFPRPDEQPVTNTFAGSAGIRG